MHPFLSQGSTNENTVNENTTWTKDFLKARSFSTEHFPVKIQKDFIMGISSFSLRARALWNKNTKCLVRKTNLGQILFSFTLRCFLPSPLCSLPVMMKSTAVTTTSSP